MKALVKQYPEPGLWLEDVPKPVITENDVLIKIKKTAICGTDLHIYNWDSWAQKTIPVPMEIGHEFVGEIVEVGSAVEKLSAGMRVSGEGHIVCSYCRNCRAGTRHLCVHTKGVGVHRPGCFAEYLSIPASNVFPIPDDISDELAAILDPLGNAVHTTLSFDLVGEDVLITGAGPIGIMAAAIAGRVGARNVVITDINDYRLELAKKMGIELAYNAKETSLSELMKKLKMTEGFDVGLEMSGSPAALQDMVTHMRPGGKIALLGIIPSGTPIDWESFIFKGLVVKGIYGRRMFETWYKMLALLQGGLYLDPIFTHEFSATDFEEAFQVMNSAKSGKVILDWSTIS